MKSAVDKKLALKVKVIWWFCLVTMTLSSLACSNQYRYAELGLDGQEVMEIINSVEATATSGGNSSEPMDYFFALANDENTSIYFADGPGPLGPVVSVLSLSDMTFLGSMFEGLYVDDFESARVALVLMPVEGGYESALMIDVVLKGDGEPLTRFFMGANLATVSNGEFSVLMVDSDGVEIVLSSRDVKGDNLKGVVQMKIHGLDANGNYGRLGKFSTLVGFTP